MPGAAGFVADQVQLQVCYAQRGGLGGHGVLAPQQHLDPGGHFVGGKRLGQVVVAAGTQAAHTFIDIGEGADHQDRRRHAHGPQGRDDRQAVEFRQHAIKGDQVVIATDRALQAFAAVVDPVHFQAMAAQFGNNFPSGHGVVFDGQYAGHRADLIVNSRQVWGHFAKKCRRLFKLTFMWLMGQPAMHKTRR
ncbi:hypothetical protein D3C73_1140420 [compost metagenome]